MQENWKVEEGAKTFDIWSKVIKVIKMISVSLQAICILFLISQAPITEHFVFSNYQCNANWWDTKVDRGRRQEFLIYEASTTEVIKIISVSLYEQCSTICTVFHRMLQYSFAQCHSMQKLSCLNYTHIYASTLVCGLKIRWNFIQSMTRNNKGHWMQRWK